MGIQKMAYVSHNQIFIQNSSDRRVAQNQIFILNLIWNPSSLMVEPAEEIDATMSSKLTELVDTFGQLKAQVEKQQLQIMVLSQHAFEQQKVLDELRKKVGARDAAVHGVPKAQALATVLKSVAKAHGGASTPVAKAHGGASTPVATAHGGASTPVATAHGGALTPSPPTGAPPEWVMKKHGVFEV